MRSRPIDAPQVGAASRRSGPESLQFFPTPPWATRALCELLAPEFKLRRQTVWEPTAGEGDMVRGLKDYFGAVVASDLHDYGVGFPCHDFLGSVTRAARKSPPSPHWVVMNPPFSYAHEFALRALDVAKVGVAVFEQVQFLEGNTRYHSLYGPNPPWVVAPFCERVPIFEGRVDRAGSSNKAYAWFIWVKGRAPQPMRWFPPGTRAACERAGDYR